MYEQLKKKNKMPEVDKKTASSFRKELYDLLTEHGVDLTKGGLHKKLSSQIRKIYEYREVRVEIPALPPMVHEIVCLDCGKKHNLVGKKEYQKHKEKLFRGMRKKA